MRQRDCPLSHCVTRTVVPCSLARSVRTQSCGMASLTACATLSARSSPSAIASIVAPEPEMRNVQAPFSCATSCSIW